DVTALDNEQLVSLLAFAKNNTPGSYSARRDIIASQNAEACIGRHRQLLTHERAMLATLRASRYPAKPPVLGQPRRFDALHATSAQYHGDLCGETLNITVSIVRNTVSGRGGHTRHWRCADHSTTRPWPLRHTASELVVHGRLSAHFLYPCELSHTSF